MLDLLNTLFFENIILLLCFEVVAIAVALAIYRHWPTPGRRLGLWITLAVCLLLIVLQQVIETDRERIQAVVVMLVDAADEGDIVTLGQNIDIDFQDRGMDKARWLEDVRQRLQYAQIDQAKVGGFKIDVDGDTALASFWASCHWRAANQLESNVVSTWKLTFKRRDDGWKLHRIVSGKIGPGGMLDYSSI